MKRYTAMMKMPVGMQMCMRTAFGALSFGQTSSVSKR